MFSTKKSQPVDTGRRDFIKGLGGALAATSLDGLKQPTHWNTQGQRPDNVEKSSATHTELKSRGFSAQQSSIIIESCSGFARDLGIPKRVTEDAMPLMAYRRTMEQVAIHAPVKTLLPPATGLASAIAAGRYHYLRNELPLFSIPGAAFAVWWLKRIADQVNNAIGYSATREITPKIFLPTDLPREDKTLPAVVYHELMHCLFPSASEFVTYATQFYKAIQDEGNIRGVEEIARKSPEPEGTIGARIAINLALGYPRYRLDAIWSGDWQGGWQTLLKIAAQDFP